MGVCFKGYDSLAALLLNHKADVNTTNFNGATALIFASTFKQVAIIKMLLEHGADTTVKDDRGNSALDHAKMQGATEVIELLEK